MSSREMIGRHPGFGVVYPGSPSVPSGSLPALRAYPLRQADRPASWLAPYPCAGRRKIFIYPAVLALLAAAATAGQYQLGLHLENDAVAETDRYFTHATRVDFHLPPSPPAGLLRRLSRIVPGLDRREGLAGLYLAQHLYTPSDIEKETPPQKDWPYGGWLHLGIQASFVKDDKLSDTMSLNLGVVGPASGASMVHKLGHSMIGSPHPRGWGTQLPNEPTIDLLMERRWKISLSRSAPVSWELLPYAGGNLGTVFALIRTGITLRAGRNMLANFASGVAHPAAMVSRDGDAPAPAWGYNVFVTAEGRAVGHNLFLDGSLFRDTRAVDKKRLVNDLIIGVNAILRDFNLTYAHVFRNKEFEGQSSPHVFGRLSIGHRF